jgi:integrase
MGRKSGSKKGTIYKEKSGRWRGQFVLPSGVTRNIQGDSEQEVEEKIKLLQKEIMNGYHESSHSEIILRKFAREFLDTRTLRPTTKDGYESIFRNHMDKIGDMKLSALRGRDFQQHYNRKLKTLSSTTVHRIHEFFHVVLERAVINDIIPSNPSNRVDVPTIHNEEFSTLTEEQVEHMIYSMRNDRYAALYILAVTTGMREAELLGLTWNNVDFKKHQVNVRNTVKRHLGQYIIENQAKSKTSRRTIPLVSVAEEALKAWKYQQEEEKQLMGDEWGNQWNLVFTTEAGTPINCHFILRRFHRLLKLANLPVIRLHDLRHTYATILIEKNVPIKVVSELLGHSSIVITLRVYGHVTTTMRTQAAKDIESIFVPQIEAEIEKTHGKTHGEERGITDSTSI